MATGSERLLMLGALLDHFEYCENYLRILRRDVDAARMSTEVARVRGLPATVKEWEERRRWLYDETDRMESNRREIVGEIRTSCMSIAASHPQLDPTGFLAGVLHARHLAGDALRDGLRALLKSTDDYMAAREQQRPFDRIWYVATMGLWMPTLVTAPPDRRVECRVVMEETRAGVESTIATLREVLRSVLEQGCLMNEGAGAYDSFHGSLARRRDAFPTMISADPPFTPFVRLDDGALRIQRYDAECLDKEAQSLNVWLESVIEERMISIARLVWQRQSPRPAEAVLN